MRQSIQQTYRHAVQEHIVQEHITQRKEFLPTPFQDTHSEERTHRQGIAWETGGVLALIAAAIASGILAQAHLG